VKGLNPDDKIEDLYIESPPFFTASSEYRCCWLLLQRRANQSLVLLEV
jgi:hypothetical protein